MSDDDPRSPCKSVCKIDPHLMTEQGSLCVGCYRTIEEITLWSNADAATKRNILNRISVRKQALRKKPR